jgi:hypothetical protein
MVVVTALVVLLIVTVVGASFFMVVHADRQCAHYRSIISSQQERIDRLTEAVAAKSGVEGLILPRPPIPVEKSSGWFDKKPFKEDIPNAKH